MKYSEIFPPVAYAPAVRVALPRELFVRAVDEGQRELEGWMDDPVRKNENLYDFAARHGVYPQEIINRNYCVWFDKTVFECQPLRLPVVVASDPPIERPEGEPEPEPRELSLLERVRSWHLGK